MCASVMAESIVYRVTFGMKKHRLCVTCMDTLVFAHAPTTARGVRVSFRPERIIMNSGDVLNEDDLDKVIRAEDLVLRHRWCCDASQVYCECMRTQLSKTTSK